MRRCHRGSSSVGSSDFSSPPRGMYLPRISSPENLIRATNALAVEYQDLILDCGYRLDVIAENYFRLGSLVR